MEDHAGTGDGAGGIGEKASSSQPLTAHKFFIEKLKHESAQQVRLEIQTFTHRFPSNLSRNEAAKRVHRFLTSTTEKMLRDCVVFAADADEEGRAKIAEGFEKCLFVGWKGKLHSQVFRMSPSDVEEDAHLRNRIRGLQWVDCCNLGIPAIDLSDLHLAIQELRCMSEFKAPRDKLVCILNACTVINNVLKYKLEEEGAKGRHLSADDFLPLLIFSCIKANPAELHSNLEFVTAFRHPSRLVGEDAYYLTTIHSAVAFIRDANAQSLDVSPDEFDQLCSFSLANQTEEDANGVAEGAASGSAISKEASVPRSYFGNSLSQSSKLERASASSRAGESAEPLTVAEKAATLPIDERRRLRRELDKLHHRFELVQSGRQLRLQDVPGLLAEYKELARILRGLQ